MSNTKKPRLSDFHPAFRFGSAQRKLVTMYLPSQLAGDATVEYPIFSAPGSVEIQSVYVVPLAAVTGQATNYRTLDCKDKGTNGAGSTSRGAYALSSGNNLAAYIKQVIVTAPFTMVPGQVLSLSNTLTGSGLATPIMQITVEYVDLLDPLKPDASSAG